MTVVTAVAAEGEGAEGVVVMKVVVEAEIMAGEAGEVG